MIVTWTQFGPRFNKRFLFAFRSNYGAILYRLRDIATYWLKIAKFLYPTCISAPAQGDLVEIS